MVRVIQLCIATGAYLWLVACVSQPSLEEGFDAVSNEARLLEINHWQLRGRAVLQGAERTDSVGLQWQQVADQSMLTLTGPVGWGRYSISVSSDYQVIELGQDFDKLPLQQRQQIENQLASLPLAQLSTWMKGVCRSCLPADVLRDSRGRLLAFTEGPWQVFYDEYQAVGKLQLPRKMRFTGPGASGKLLLKEWQLGDGS